MNKQMIWQQFGASIDMLENAINACPAELWHANPGFQDFWYMAYHTIFFLDFYLTDNPDDYKPFSFFGITELDPEGIFPDRVFTKNELLSFLQHGRLKCRKVIDDLDEKTEKIYRFGTMEIPFNELLLYSMRHVQHHTAQLNLLLRQNNIDVPRWVRRAK